MSELNNDQDVVQEGRRAPLKNVDAPLRDQIVDKLFKKLEEDEIGVKVANMWMRANADRKPALERQKIYLENWDSHTIGDTSGSFDGSSQLHIPMPLIVCKTLHARFNQALMGVDPPFQVKARNEASTDRVALVSDTLRYTLSDYYNCYKGVEEVVDRWIWDWITTGTGLMKLRWDIQFTRFIDVTEEEQDGAPLFKRDPATGKEVLIPTKKRVEKEVKRTKKVFDGPMVDLVNLEDLVLTGSNDPDLADAVLERVLLTGSQLWTLADRKVFKANAVEEIIEGGEDKQFGAQGGDIKYQRAVNAGNAVVDSEQDLDRYEIIEGYLKYDVDGSGITADIIVWVHLRTHTLMRATYLHRVNKAGERPYVKADFHPRKGQEFAAGMVELLYPLSKEMDAIHNMRIDMGIISVMPFGFYRASSGIDPETVQLEPGALIPCDNPQTDVYFPNLGNRTVFGFQEEQAIQTMIERLTSISDVNMGVVGAQGVTRTASGSRLLNQEMSSNIDVYLRRLNRGWKKFLKYTLHMLQQRIPPGLGYRLTGDDGQDYWRQIRSADDLAGDYDLEISPTMASSNMGIQQEVAQQVMQLVANPMAVQLGLVTPGQFYEAMKFNLQAMGIRDFGRFVQKPQGYTHVPSPEEEANRVLHGMDVPVTMNMDHQGFIDFFQHIHDNDDLLGQFSKQDAIRLKQQAMKHEQMLQAMKQMQAQSANAQQMRQNAAQSQQQAPQAMNPMQGAMNGQA